MGAYRLARMMTTDGVSPERVRAMFAEDLARVDLGPVAGDEYGLENFHSINSRAIDDALSGREPEPIWALR